MPRPRIYRGFQIRLTRETDGQPTASIYDPMCPTVRPHVVLGPTMRQAYRHARYYVDGWLKSEAERVAREIAADDAGGIA